MDISPLNKLVDCAKAIEGGNLNDADLLLKEIIAANESLSRATKSLVKYYAEALVRRLYKLYPRNLTPLIPSGTDRLPETDYPFAPFFCFGDFTTLDPARDALKGKQRVHIIEFGIVVSFWRYYDLFRDITTQSAGPISFRLTFVGPILSIVADHTQKTLESLHGEAERFAIDFEVRHLVANSAADIVDSVLKLTRASEDETIVVKWKFQLHKLLTLTGAIEKVLSKLKELKPEIMIIVEQEASHNGQNLLDCFSKSFQYYSIVFDSIDKDNLDINSNGVRRKVLWEMYFRRQICKLVAPGGTDHIERHETFAYWQDRLRRFGFRHYRFKPKSFNNFCREQMPEYSWEEKDRHPVLRRKGIPLIFSSAWKPDPTQLNSGSTMELDKENYSKFHENQPDDPRIMTEVTWSEKYFSINQIAASAEIYDILEYTCNVHNLPLGLTWISDRRDYIENSNGKLRIVESACYLNDITMDGFVEACGQHHLEEGQGAAGKALQLNGMYFIPDVSKLSADAYPFVCDAWEFGLHAAVSFKLENTHMSRVDYVLEFFLPAETKEVSEYKLLIDGISSILQKNCRNSWAISGMELSEDNMDSVVRSEGAMTDRSPPALLDHGIEIGVEAHEQDVEEQNSTFEAASNEIASILQQKSRNSWKDFSEQLNGANFSSEFRIENFETSDVRPAGISDSYHSLNSSEVRILCNIFNPTSDGVEVQEAHDQEMGEQNSACGAASNEITSTLQKNPWKSWKDNSGELSGADFSSDVRIEEVGTSKARPAAISDSYLNSSKFMELCNISNPASDGEEVQEARDQEVEEQDSAFVPAAPSPDNEEVGRDSSRLNASARNKRRRTSEVWQYFDEVTENGEIWAKCKSCSNRYRGESKRGTTNLRRHLEKYCAGRK